MALSDTRRRWFVQVTFEICVDEILDRTYREFVSPRHLYGSVIRQVLISKNGKLADDPEVKALIKQTIQRVWDVYCLSPPPNKPRESLCTL